jgi:hypothetical protein
MTLNNQSGLRGVAAVTGSLCLLMLPGAKAQDDSRETGAVMKAAVTGSSVSTNATVASKGFLRNTRIVAAEGPVIEKVLWAKQRMKELSPSREQKEGPRTLQEAAEFLAKNISMAHPPTKCVEHGGVFYFSGGTSAKAIDDFSSGFAIRKGESAIYTWSEVDEDRKK